MDEGGGNVQGVQRQQGEGGQEAVAGVNNAPHEEDQGENGSAIEADEGEEPEEGCQEAARDGFGRRMM